MRDVPEDQLVTTAEAAKRLGISRSAMAGYYRRGVLRAAIRLPSGQLRWRMDDVMAQLAELERRARED